MKKVLFIILCLICFTGFVKAEKCYVANANSIKLGDKVTCENEPFRVAAFDGDKVILFAEYDLLIGKICYSDTSCETIPTTASSYGMQYPTALGMTSRGYPTVGVIPFSESVYWLDSYGHFIEPYGNPSEGSSNTIYGPDSLLYPHIENYKEELIAKGINVLEARLLSWNEFSAARAASGENYKGIAWLSTGNIDSRGVLSTTGGGMYFYDNSTSIGIRPAVIIYKSDLATKTNTTVESYDINIDSGDNGDISCSKTTSEAWKQITFTVTPDEGFELGEIKVTDSDGKNVILVNNTFTMPYSDVTIEATFTKQADPEPEDPENPEEPTEEPKEEPREEKEEPTEEQKAAQENPKTGDYILNITLLAILAALVFIRNYRKINYLKKN